jgi:Putative beta-barrel porin-2, OmpL-like. bbp2
MKKSLSLRKIFFPCLALILSTGFLIGSPFVLMAHAEDDENSIGKKLGLSLYGFVSTSYTQNFNNPASGTNQNRIFDGDANSFRPNLAQIVLEKVAKASGDITDRAGFRIKLNFGEDAKFTGGTTGTSGPAGTAADPGDAGEDFDFQEAYVQYLAPLGNGLLIQAGRMNTLIGYEVIESYVNPNFSRSFMFGMGEPFTVTGVRASYDFNDSVSFAISGINSFTGAQVDGNNSKSIEALLSLAPMDKVAVSLFGFWGPEIAARGVSNTDRLLFGGILDVNVTEKAEVVVEAYYANQANAGGAGTANSRWNGVAGYFIYDFTDQWGARVRAEIFEDAGGTQSCANRVGTPNGLGNALICSAGSTAAQTLWEMTYTLQFKPVPNLITRAEFRYDKSNNNTFQDGAGVGNNQSTLAAEAIFLF